jgi:hypothetical protein
MEPVSASSQDACSPRLTSDALKHFDHPIVVVAVTPAGRLTPPPAEQTQPTRIVAADAADTNCDALAVLANGLVGCSADSTSQALLCADSQANPSFAVCSDCGSVVDRGSAADDGVDDEQYRNAVVSAKVHGMSVRDALRQQQPVDDDEDDDEEA